MPTDHLRLDPPDALAAGVSLIDTPDGRHLVAAPDGTFTELRLDDEQWRALRHRLGRPGEGSAPDAADDAVHQRVQVAVEHLRREGLLDDDRLGASPPRSVEVVAWPGATVVADAIATLLTLEGVTARIAAAPDRPVPPGPADVVVACAAHLPDEAWLELDDELQVAGTPSHRCWIEGTAARIGPLSVPGRSASYSDLRARRLAASSWPDELLATWRTPPISPCPWTHAAAASAAAAVVGDLLASRRGQVPDAVAASWRELDLPTRRWSAHPVLPLPIGILR